jgi:hypothetical protein
MKTPTVEKIHLISIYEPKMPRTYHAKKPTFGNLNSLVAHHINGLKESTFSTWHVRNKYNSTLKRPLTFS